MSRLTVLARRLRSLFRRGREDAETQDELRFHLEMETEKNLRAGLDPREARRRAHVRLGGVDAIREAVRDARGARPLEDLVRDLGYTVRGLRRNPGFTLAAIVSLAIPIAFNTTTFTIVDSILFRPLPFVRGAQIVDVYTSHPVDPWSTSSYADYLDLRAENGVFTDMAAHSPMMALLRVDVDADVDLVLGETVTGNYFEFLGVRPVLGRLLAPDDDRPGAQRVVVISSGLWERAFGRDPAVVGRTLRIRSQPYLVVGVAPPAFFGAPPIPGGGLWTAMTWVDDVTPVGISTFEPSPGDTRLERRGQRWMLVKGRLRDGVTLAQADANLDVIMADLAAAYPDSNEGRRVSLARTNDVRLPPDMAGPVYAGAVGLMLVLGLVLLVACANVMGMLLARVASRRREIGVRLALGANRRRLVQQLLTESLVLSSFGALAGLVLVGLGLRVLGQVEPPPEFPTMPAFALDARAFLYTAALATSAGALAGLVPALGATRPNLVRGLNGAVAVARAGGRPWLLRDALVAAQLAVTVPLLVLAGLLARSATSAAADASLGFHPDRVAAVAARFEMTGYDPEQADRFMLAALERVQSMPGVEAASRASRAPLAVSFSPLQVLVPELHGPADRGATIDRVVVSEDYFDTLGVPLLQGRTFTAADTRESPLVAIISEAMARRFWPAGTAVGRRLRVNEWDGPEYEVVGVAADYKVRFPTEGPASYLHLAASQHRNTGGLLLARTVGDATVLAADIRRELRRMEPGIYFPPQGYNTLRETAADMVFPIQMAASVATASGVVAMLLGAIGLYGVVAYLVVRRTRELAIRSALGARAGSLVRTVLATGAWMVAAGVGAGAFLAVVVTRLAAQVMPGIAAADPIAWAGALLLIVGVTAAAHVQPARRILKLDLMRALHAE
jgi:predicted permease